MNKPQADQNLRERIFDDLFGNYSNADFNYVKINDRQYGVLLPDVNGVTRYIRIGAIVAEERQDMTAEQLMQKEIEAYNLQQKKKAEKKLKDQEKIARDKAKREKAKEVSEN